MRLVLLAAAACIAMPALAQVGTAIPQPLPMEAAMPAPRDVPYPGTLRLEVDASDTSRGIYRVVETIPVAGPGPLTLLYPEWLPGNHGPRGPINSIAGLRITANGRPVEWRRDSSYVYAFHVDVPEGARSLRVEFQHLSPTDPGQGRVTMTPNMLNLQWEKMSLYPAGYFTRGIPIEAVVAYPAGWSAATSLDVAARAGNRLTYRTVPYETLVDSPVFAGRYYRRERLTENINLNLFADEPGDLAATPEQIAIHRRAAEQEVKLFGTVHFDEYEYLVALTDELGGIGLEHLRSSENSHPRDYFTDWNSGSAGRDLLTHEFTHSWNGKYRRPADLWTPNYNVPMRDSLLWVYEGQTQFWGNILAARSGLMPTADVLDELARTAAFYDTLPGRSWRPLIDTTNDPIVQARRSQPWPSWMRGEDYYSEGMLIWLEVDARLRQLSGGRRSMNDFARAFFGVNPGDQGVATYTFDDVVATLNAIAPFDWAAYLHERVDRVRPHAPLDWIAAGGYRLVYRDTPSAYFKSREKDRKILDLTFSVGAVIGEGGRISGVAWDSPMFDVGATAGATIVAVGGEQYSNDLFRRAIAAAHTSRDPIRLLIKRGDRYREVALDYHDGLRYPALERVGTGPSGLDALLAPLP
ncbi:MAG: M61 family metallopeptidase [Alphaproteobacteria bacterium]|nr:MAG: M61 family metallopeptidase [Alphaproteobacteria bacterium]